MAETDRHDEISRIDQRIEALGDTVERCRKVALGARVAIVAGGLWLVAGVVGAVHSDAAATLAAIAAVIGGTVAAGSNATTLAETLRTAAEVESERTALIDGLDLQVVRERTSVPAEPAALAGDSS